jgi:hypothetical protein
VEAPQVSAAGLAVWVRGRRFALELGDGDGDEAAAGRLRHLALQAGLSVSAPLFIFDQEGHSPLINFVWLIHLFYFFNMF